ncbi:hypothetical protein DWUX_1371 [Desulfovibrio diazotrophicus]|nr:hypothetical protein DWUX_1371 [Desulfovibrio diazotrophicus]
MQQHFLRAFLHAGGTPGAQDTPRKTAMLRPCRAAGPDGFSALFAPTGVPHAAD